MADPQIPDSNPYATQYLQTMRTATAEDIRGNYIIAELMYHCAIRLNPSNPTTYTALLNLYENRKAKADEKERGHLEMCISFLEKDAGSRNVIIGLHEDSIDIAA